MILLSITNNITNKINLPDKINGEFYLNDDKGFTYALVRAYQTEWHIIPLGNSKIMENNAEKEYVVPKENTFFTGVVVKDKKVICDFTIFCYPNNDQTFSEWNVNKSSITVGSNSGCDIVYPGFNVDGEHLVLTYANNYWSINSTKGVFVNGTLTNKRTLYHGDCIFLSNLRIIVLSNFLIINNPNNVVKLKPDALVKRDSIKVTLLDASNKDVEDDRPLFDDKSYFNKSPRFMSVIEPVNFSFNAPPASRLNQNQNPAILTIGPQITMSMTTIMTMSMTLINLSKGNGNIQQVIITLVSCFAMFMSMFFWPTITRRYQKRHSRKEEIRRKKEYRAYLHKKEKDLLEICESQKQILIDNNIPLEHCFTIVGKRDRRLWERNLFDSDFLTVRLGIGQEAAKINIKFPEEGFSLTDEDTLQTEYKDVLNSTRYLNDVPLNISLKNKFYTAIVGNNNLQLKRFVDTLMLQIMTFHSYTDLKIAVFTSEDKKKNWDYFSILPHCWDNDRNFRMFATNPNEAKQVSCVLERVLGERLESLKESDGKGHIYAPQYLIFTDDLSTFKQTEIYKKLDKLSASTSCGFSILIQNNRLSNLPSKCSTFIYIDGDNSAVFENELSTNKQKQFKAEVSKALDVYAVAKQLANIPIEVEKGSTALVSSLGFLEMYKIGRVEQLNSLKRWAENNPVASLAVPIGVDVNNNLINMDIHEKFHGPHGLVAGTTGSGKSETIITYILSLAVNFHPYEMQFVLIDYKGGGLAGSFENKETGMKLPHLIGTITNLDKVEINRSLASIRSELRRRQAAFNKAREKLNVSSMDIYKYQRYYREGKLDEPMAHLLIISDEFAELKAQEPEFLDQLVSTARIGRSLGVHLILATQKPSGVVNDQIRSNSKFSICLKVADKSDSTDMIDRPDAAFLKQSGAFYLLVGNGEYFTLGQSAYSGAKYTPSDVIVSKVDKSMEVLDGVGQTKLNLDVEAEGAGAQSEAHGEELLNVITYLSDLAKEENIQTKRLWLERIPDVINTEDIKKKYNYQKVNYYLNPVIGEYDDPSNQAQNIFTLDLGGKGNAAIFGSAGYGKENLIVSMLYSLATTYYTEEFNAYIVDYGAGLLKIFQNTPQVGDVVSIEDGRDKLDKLFRMIDNIIAERREKFIDYGGSYELFIKNSKEKCPMIVLVINAYDVLSENYDYDDYFRTLTRDCAKYGVVCVFTSTATNAINSRIKQNISNIISMYQIKDSEYDNVVDNNHKVVPSETKGRGIFNANDWTYEFQTALPCEESNIAPYMKKINELLGQKMKTKAPRIPILPNVVTLNNLIDNNTDPDIIPIGYNKYSLDMAYLDFKKHNSSLIISEDTDTFYPFTKGLMSLFNKRTFHLTMVLDMENSFKDVFINNIKYFGSNQCEEFYRTLLTFNQDIKNKMANNEKFPMKVYIVIIGVSKFYNTMYEIDSSGIDQLFEGAEKLKSFNYIFIESIDKVREFTSEQVFRNSLSDTDGLYIGNGFDEQMVLKTKGNARANRENEILDASFGVLVNNGAPISVKIINEIEGEHE